MAGRVPLENASKKKQNGRSRFGRRLLISEITRLQKKKEPPGRNLGITLKINKWALLKETACNEMKSTTYPYHVVLVPKQNTKKGNESGINYPGELKRRIPHGDTKYLLGTVVKLIQI
jgi:hypothetical protein